MRQREAAIVLKHESRRLAPFDYVALLAYGLSEPALTIELQVRHKGALEVASGLGFHPWFPRTSDTRLCAPAAHVWLENEAHLPTKRVPIPAKPEWDFGAPVHLPASWINACFEGWGGAARITWPARGLGLGISASANLTRYIVYSPSGPAESFCFEPVSHSIDGHGAPDPQSAGPVLLRRGHDAACAIALTPFERGEFRLAGNT